MEIWRNEDIEILLLGNLSSDGNGLRRPIRILARNDVVSDFAEVGNYVIIPRVYT